MLFDRRAALAAVAGMAVAGCEFRPIHRGNRDRVELAGRVRVEEARGRAGFYLVRALRRRLGTPKPGPEFSLTVDVRTSSKDVVISTTTGIRRYVLLLTADYSLKNADSLESIAQNSIEVATSVNTTESPFATYASERAHVRTAAVDAADRILRDIYLRLALRGA